MNAADGTTWLNQTGQAMGTKGRGTRLRLMQATSGLLETTTLSGLRVADIAAAAGTSTAAFYRYFADAADIVLAIVADCTQSTEPLLELASRDWTGEDAAQQALAFVRTYFETWERHAAVLRVRNLAAEAGDERFYAARERAVRPLQDVLTGRLQRRLGLRAGEGLEPAALSGALIALLERMAAISRKPRGQREITHESLVAATAHILLQTLDRAHS